MSYLKNGVHFDNYEFFFENYIEERESLINFLINVFLSQNEIKEVLKTRKIDCEIEYDNYGDKWNMSIFSQIISSTDSMIKKNEKIQRNLSYHFNSVIEVLSQLPYFEVQYSKIDFNKIKKELKQKKTFLDLYPIPEKFHKNENNSFSIEISEEQVSNNVNINTIYKEIVNKNKKVAMVLLYQIEKKYKDVQIFIDKNGLSTVDETLESDDLYKNLNIFIQKLKSTFFIKEKTILSLEQIINNRIFGVKKEEFSDFLDELTKVKEKDIILKEIKSDSVKNSNKKRM